MKHADKTGGPAFPGGTMPEHPHHPNGMTLRDYFAGQALANIADSYNGQAFDPHGFARIAYEYADAMIKARAEQ